MIHGKRGFERIVWSFKNVLHSTVTWLIYDSRDENGKNDTRKALHAYQRVAT